MSDLFDTEQMLDNLYRKHYNPIVRERLEGRKSKHYSGRKLPIGWNTEDKKKFELDFSQVSHSIFLGKTRHSGKTVAQQSMATRAQKAGYGVVILTDVRNEYKSMRKPLQKEYHKYLLNGEYPQGFDMRIYRPVFLSEMTGEGFSSYHTPIQISFSQISPVEMFYLLGITKEKDMGKQQIVDRIIKQGRKTGNINTLEDFQQAIMTEMQREHSEFELFTKNQAEAVMRRIEGLKTYSVLGDDYPFDIVNDINSGRMVTVDMRDYDYHGDSDYSVAQVYVTALSRILIKAKENRQIPPEKPLLIIIEETPTFIPQSKARVEPYLLKKLGVVGAYGIYFCFATQNVDDVPDKIIKNCRYAFLSKVSEIDMDKKILAPMGLWRSVSAFTDAYRRGKAKRVGKYEWVLADAASPMNGGVVDRYDEIEDKRRYMPFNALNTVKFAFPLGAHQPSNLDF